MTTRTIETRWMKSTTRKPARVSARSDSGARLEMEYSPRWDVSGNHEEAARRLAAQCGYTGPMVRNGNVFTYEI